MSLAISSQSRDQQCENTPVFLLPDEVSLSIVFGEVMPVEHSIEPLSLGARNFATKETSTNWRLRGYCNWHRPCGFLLVKGPSMTMLRKTALLATLPLLAGLWLTPLASAHV